MSNGTPENQQRGDAFELFDLRVVVDRIEGRSVCGMKPGDYFDVTDSSRVKLPADGHFCMYALAAVLPLLPAKQRRLDAADWMEIDSEVCCPDPEERLIMRIERRDLRKYGSDELT